MARGRCPNCDELVRITPTDRPVGETGTARRWRIADHEIEIHNHRTTILVVERCEGSGKLV